MLNAVQFRRVRDEVRTWWRWWLAELSALLPESWRHGLKLGRDDLVLMRGGERCRLERRRLQGVESLAVWNCDQNDNPREAWTSDALKRLSEARDTCRVILELADRGQILLRDILLPLAAEDNLGNVLGYEMDRHTPFPASQVFYGYRVLSRRPATAQIQVRLVVIPRARLETWLMWADRWGLYPERVVVASEPDIDLMPTDHRRARRHLPRINAWLASIVVVLAGSLVFTPLWIMRDINRTLHAEMQRLQPHAMELERLREYRDQLDWELNRLFEKKAQYPAVIDGLNELARVLPDDTWLSSVQYADHRFIVHGQSESASGLIALIEASPYFERSAFVAPVSRDRYGRDNFQLVTHIRLREQIHATRGVDPQPDLDRAPEAAP